MVVGREPEALARAGSAPAHAAGTSTANISNTVWLDVMDRFRGLVNEGNRHNEAIHKQTVDGNVIISGHSRGAKCDTRDYPRQEAKAR